MQLFPFIVYCSFWLTWCIGILICAKMSCWLMKTIHLWISVFIASFTSKMWRSRKSFHGMIYVTCYSSVAEYENGLQTELNFLPLHVNLFLTSGPECFNFHFSYSFKYLHLIPCPENDAWSLSEHWNVRIDYDTFWCTNESDNVVTMRMPTANCC